MSTRKPKLKLVASTPFSEFIRNASFAEKERVYTEVMRKVAERQQRILAEAAAARRKDTAL
jgi:hypothetical protein